MSLLDRIFGRKSLQDFITESQEKQTTTLMAKLTDLAGRLTGIETVLNKVKTEVEALRKALEDVDLPAEAEAALGRLEAVAKMIDELNPDAPTPPA